MPRVISARVATYACAVVFGLLMLVAASANAASVRANGAGVTANASGTCPSGETAVSSYATLQSDVASATAGPDGSPVFCLTKSLADASTTPGGLVVDSYSIELDLNGYSLTISHAGTGTPGITNDDGFTVEDNSVAQTGILTVTGGAASSTQGGGAGIGGGQGDFNIFSGTVKATGGSSSTGTTGAGAGVGGNGGTSGTTGGAGPEVASFSGTLTAIGGASTATSNNTAGAGAGIGGGGGGSGALGGEANFFEGYGGGEVDVTAGTLAASATGLTAADGFGDGGGTGTQSYPDSPRSQYAQSAIFEDGTTTISGEWNGGLGIEASGAVDVSSNKTLDLGASGYGTLVNGTLNDPAGSTLTVDDGLELNTATTFAGRLNINADGTLEIGSYAGTSTLANPGPVLGLLNVGNGSTLVIPSGATVALDGPTSAEFVSGPLNSNAGTIDLQGTLTGSSTLANSGNIFFDGSGASIPGNGLGEDGQLGITINAYTTTYSVPAPGTAPADVYVFADSFADGGESLPAEPAITGYTATSGWEAGTTSFGNDSSLSSVANNGVVAFTGIYEYNPVVSDTPSQPTVGIGGAVSVLAHLAGSATFGSPTGTVNFYVCGPPSSSSGCSSTGTPVGGAVNLDTGSGNGSTAQSAAFTPTAVGTYCFYSVYSGDANNEPESDSSSDGCFTVPSGPSQSYAMSTDANITFGASDTDAATIYGAPGGGSPTGTVTFYECGPSTIEAYCSSTANPVGTAVTLTQGSGGTSTATSPVFTPTQAGDYCFNAVYSGDGENLSSSDGSTDSQCFNVAVAAATVSTPTSSKNPTVEGEPVQLSTTVGSSDSSSTPNSGQVTFFVNGDTTVCTAQVISGHASCDTASLPVGTDSITARYEGNASFSQTAVSAALTQTVTPNSQFTVQGVSSNIRTAKLAVRLKLPAAGTVTVAVRNGKRTASHSQPVRLARSAKSAEVTVKLALSKLERAALHGHSGVVTLKLAITFHPAGGKARTVTRTIHVRVRRSATH